MSHFKGNQISHIWLNLEHVHADHFELLYLLISFKLFSISVYKITFVTFTWSCSRIFKAITDFPGNGKEGWTSRDRGLCRHGRVRVRDRHQEDDLLRVESVEGRVQEFFEGKPFFVRCHVRHADVVDFGVSPEVERTFICPNAIA